MAKWVQVTRPDGSIFKVPAIIIVDAMIKDFAASMPPNATPAEAWEDAPAHAKTDKAIIEYAEIFVEWDDVKSHAVEVSAPPTLSPAEIWATAEKEMTE